MKKVSQEVGAARENNNTLGTEKSSAKMCNEAVGILNEVDVILQNQVDSK